MDPILLIGSVGLPLVFGIGGIIAWRARRAQAEREDQPATWRDDSLDDWRRERDEQLAAERERRAREPQREDPDDVPTTQAREGEKARRTQSRLGG